MFSNISLSLPTITLPTVSLPSTSLSSIVPTFHMRPSWNMTFTSVAKTLQYGAAMVPINIKAIRMLTDHEIPAWAPTMPSGIVHMKTNRHVKGEWYYERSNHGKNHKKLNHEERIVDIKESLQSKNVILYIHGGAFCLCNSGTHRALMYQLVKSTRQVIFSVEYRRPPEHTYPLPLEDCLIAYLVLLNQYVQGDASKIILAGDSAGGNLVMHLLLTLLEKNLPLPAGAILISPWIDLTDTGDGSENSSWEKNMKYDFITKPLATFFADCYVGNYHKTAKTTTSTSSNTTGMSLSFPSWFSSASTTTDHKEDDTTTNTPPIGSELDEQQVQQVNECIRMQDESIVLDTANEENKDDYIVIEEEKEESIATSSDNDIIDDENNADDHTGLLFGGLSDKKDVSPLHASDELLRQLPPMYITVGQCEVLHDQIVAFIDKLKSLEVPNVRSFIAEDMIHVYPLFQFTGMPQCKEFFQQTVDFMKSIKRGHDDQLPWLEHEELHTDDV